MNEVRDICDRMLDGPAPPMRGAADVLATARAASRRRQWLGAAGAGGAALCLVLGIAVVFNLPAKHGEVVAAGPLPAARAAAAHGEAMAAILVEAVPGGYTTGPAETFSHDPVVRLVVPGPGHPQVLAAAVLRVFADGGAGQLFAYLVHDGEPPPAKELCGHSGSGAAPWVSCDVVTVEGVPIRVITSHDDRRGWSFEATRYLDGGRLTVGAFQAVPVDPTQWRSQFSGEAIWNQPPLPQPLLDAATVASLAANPEMLP